MGGLKLEICVDVCVHKKGVKMKDLHTIWDHYHALILFFVDLTHGEPRCMCKIEDFDRVSFDKPDNNRRSRLSATMVPEMSTGWSLY